MLVESDDGYKAVQQPFGRCWVYGPDGKPINDRPLTKEEALHLFKTINETPDADVGSSAEEVAEQINKGGTNGTET